MPILLTCLTCGSTFETKASRIRKGKGKYCSYPCFQKRKRPSLEERFWSKVDIKGPDDCWLWKRAVFQGTGYGVFEGPEKYAHRMAWVLKNGPIPDGILVCHTCDVKLCCNPSHHFLGTDLDNALDASRKGLLVQKLTPQNIKDICESYVPRKVTQAALAARYGVSKNRIDLILAKHGIRERELRKKLPPVNQIKNTSRN